MVQAVCKNTFISFRADMADEEGEMTPSSLMHSSPRVQPRSRSMESLSRYRPEADEFQELSRQSLHRINAVLSVGISSPPQSPKNSLLDSTVEFMLDQQPAKPEEPGEFPSSPGAVLSDLRSLQGKLAMALAGKMGKDKRDLSNCSLSTMAPDEVPECGELPRTSLMSREWSSGSVNTLGSGKKMAREWSSGSVSTLWSDLNDLAEEDEDEVEFDLDIEAGVAAALGETAAPHVAAGTEVPDVDAVLTEAKSVGFCSGLSKKASEMSHSQVPRKHNMEEVYNSSKDDAPTTMMIRNIPGRYSQNDLMMDLRDLGLAGTYNFLYMPVDKGTSANVGYAFVNFTNASWAEKCMQRFGNYRFSRHQRSSNKLARVSVAHLQGLEKNLQHYENAAVNLSKEKQRRPVVVASIAAEMFG